jgi:hypothetical protein
MKNASSLEIACQALNFQKTLGTECLLVGHLQVSDLHSFTLVTEYKKLKKIK